MTGLTTDREAFIRAIIAAPEDDAPRLVFADWLEENGEPERAKYIRWQVTEAEVIANCKFLKPEIVYSKSYPEIGIILRRGFPDEVRCNLNNWMQHGPEIVQREPIQWVALTDIEAEYEYSERDGEVWAFDFTRRSFRFWLPSDEYTRHTLPPEIHGVVDAKREPGKWFRDPMECYKWLSDRCLAWAKSATT